MLMGCAAYPRHPRRNDRSRPKHISDWIQGWLRCRLGQSRISFEDWSCDGGGQGIRLVREGHLVQDVSLIGLLSAIHR